ncbi:MAG: LytR/AlgR family response regulator transcription factor [Bacillota bacterium]|jgi:two-component system LytT family response regulator
MSLKVIIADDEIEIVGLLESILTGIEGVEIVGQANSVYEAKRVVGEKGPDLAILDIQFIDGSGISLAKELKSVDPNIDLFFITAYPDYAIEAFKLYSFDYILKPIDEDRVIKTIKKIKKKREASLEQSNLSLGKSNSPCRLVIKNGAEIVLVQFNDILFIERDGRKSKVHCINNVYETPETLKNIENKLNQKFFRTHKSYIVNLEHVEKVKPWNMNTYQIKFHNSTKQAHLSRKNVRLIVDKLLKLST